jgi:hypothetical protein
MPLIQLDVSNLKIFQLKLKYRDDFNELDAFTALRFTATRASPAAKRTRILRMTQHAWRRITFGMKENNELVDLNTV